MVTFVPPNTTKCNAGDFEGLRGTMHSPSKLKSGSINRKPHRALSIIRLSLHDGTLTVAVRCGN